MDAEQPPGGGFPHASAGGAGTPSTSGRRSSRRTPGSSGPSSRACTALRRLRRPVLVSIDPWRAWRVGATQSNWSTPEGDRLQHPDRVPHPHQVPGTVGGQVGHGGGHGLEHGRAGLAHRQSADAVAVEFELGGPPGALLAQRRIGARPARSRTGPGPRAWPRGAGGPSGPGPPTPPSGRRPPAGPRSAPAGVAHTSRTIWMSAPIRPWASTADSGVSRIRSTVVDRGEGHPVVVDRRAERVDLVAAGVGQGVTVPAGEPVQPARGRRRCRPRAGASGGTCWPARPRPPATRGRRCPAP